MQITHHDRFGYSDITGRPDFSWPEGRRLAVYVALNIEVFSFGEGPGAQLAPGGPEPDVMNYAWRDYGNRVGAPRIRDMMAHLGLPLTVLANSDTYERCPGLIESFRSPANEIIAHGRNNAERPGTLDEGQERALIEEVTQVLQTREGRHPGGWLGPWISQSHQTPDLLQEAGYGYLMDWAMDDQPVWMDTRKGRILSLPYPQELNDIPQIVGRNMTGRAFGDMIVDAFDWMRTEARARPMVMGIALHGYLMGQAHRAPHLARALRHIADSAGEDVWLTTSGQIAAHYAGLDL